MKKLFTTLALVAAISGAASAQTKLHDVAKFDKESVEMGTIKQGVPAPATFTVTNIGKSPLIIEKAQAGCGCTMADYTKSPILPGQTGMVKATYNAAAAGKFNKGVTVKFAGVEEVVSLAISGEVEAPKVAGNH
jgi:hypothetical protein